MARLLNLFLLSLIGITVRAEARARDLDRLYEKAKFMVGASPIDAYIADTDPKRMDGLMLIDKLNENTGMLFVFEEEERLSFWMKNTVIPLSIGYFNDRGELVDIQEMSVPNSLLTLKPASYPSRKPAQFALEMNKGWFTKKKIKLGTRLKSLKPVSSALLNSKLPSRQ